MVQMVSNGSSKMVARGIGIDLILGLVMTLSLVVVTPKMRFCSFGSLLDFEGVRSLMPGVM